MTREKADGELIRRLRLEQKTIKEISMITGYAMSTVENYLYLYGLTKNKADWKRQTHREDAATIARWRLAMAW